MARLSITKIFTFEAAHILRGYDGACANIHGHSYRLEVSVYAPALDLKPGSFLHSDAKDPKNGMLFDFSELKKLVNTAVIEPFDHSLILNAKGDVLAETLQTQGLRIVSVPYQPTSENLLMDFAARLQAVLPQGIALKKLRLYETATSFTDYDLE